MIDMIDHPSCTPNLHSCENRSRKNKIVELR